MAVRALEMKSHSRDLHGALRSYSHLSEPVSFDSDGLGIRFDALVLDMKFGGRNVPARCRGVVS